MLHVQCANPACPGEAYIECVPGCEAVMGAHLHGCPSADLDAQVVCPDPAATGCCPQDHHHGLAANSCPGHEGEHHKGNPECAVCRPLVITAMPGSAQIQMTGG